MTRFVTYILLLAVFFFGGAFYGSLQNEPENEKNIPDSLEQIEQTSMDVNEREAELVPLPKEERDHPMNHLAKVCEKIVVELYEAIIQLMFRIANFFFNI